MIRFLLHHPELLIAAGLLIAGFAYFVGWKVGRWRGWQNCEKHVAPILREKDWSIERLGQIVRGLQQDVENLGGPITRTFVGNIGHPGVLEAAEKAMEKLQAEAAPIPEADLPSNRRKITPD